MSSAGAVTTTTATMMMMMMKDEDGMILNMCIKCPARVHYCQSGLEGFARSVIYIILGCLAGKVSIGYERANL